MSVIQEYEDGVRFPIIGKIRLGLDKNGSFPENTNYFVLKDAPGVEGHYGEKPQELIGFFPSDNIEEIAPSSYKWFLHGKRTQSGNRAMGSKMCEGNGPKADGSPGKARMLRKFDGSKMIRLFPPEERECHGRNCPDAFDEKGNPKCKASMALYFMLPHVTLDGAYALQTTSRVSMNNVYSLLNFYRNNGVPLNRVLFKMKKEQVDMPRVDRNTGEEKKGKQWVVKLYPHEANAEEQAKIVAEYREKLKYANPMMALKAADRQQALDPDELYPVALPEAQENAEKLDSAEELLKDPEINELFNRLEKASGKAFTPKARLIAVRKKQNESDFRGAVVATLQGAIDAANPPQEVAPAKAKPKPKTRQKPKETPAPVQEAEVVDVPAQAVPPVQQAQAQDAPPPPQDDGGIW
jgi:hypothetical protein